MHRLTPSTFLLLVLLLGGSLLPVKSLAVRLAPPRPLLAAAGPALPGPAVAAFDPADDLPEALPAPAVDVLHPEAILLPALPRPLLRPWVPQQNAFFHLSRPPPQSC